MTDNGPQAISIETIVRLSRVGDYPGEFVCQPPGRRQKEMTGTAGWIDDPEPEKGLLTVGGVLFNGFLDDRLQSGSDKFLNEGRRGIVAACQLPDMTADLARFVQPEEREGPGDSIDLDVRVKLQEAFVDASQFLCTHIVIVDPGKNLPRLEKGQGENGLEKMVIVHKGNIQKRALVSPKKTSQRRQTQRHGSSRKSPEGHREAFPEVRAVIVMVAFEGKLPESGDTVAFLINLFLLIS